MNRLIFAIPILAIAGCFQSDARSQGAAHVVRTYHEEGTQGGVAFAKTGQEETSTDTQTTSTKTVGLDPDTVQNLIKAAATAATGGSYGPLAAAAGSIAAAAGAAWLNARKNGQEHKADADDAWERLAAVKGLPNV